jgi:hypothetical protein
MSKICLCGKSIKENYKMCFNCSKKKSIENVNKPLQNIKQTLIYKQNKELPTLEELKNKKIKEGDEYRCSYTKCENVLIAGKNCKESNYFYCYPCYLQYLKDDYKQKIKKAYDDDDFIDD